jgi:hypothetical protein
MVMVTVVVWVMVMVTVVVWVVVVVTVVGGVTVTVTVRVWVMVMVTVVGGVTVTVTVRVTVVVVVPMNRYDRWNVRIWSWTPPQRQYSCISSRGCVLAMQARESREKLLVVRLWNRILDWKWGLRVWSL